MRFEKLNENKIKITLSKQDLLDKDINFHDFMANSAESQNLVFNMLDEAEKEIGFVTRDYRIRIEALAMNDGDFILTITRSLPETTKLTRKKVHIKRKNTSNYVSTQAIYRFNVFDDFLSFVEFMHNCNYNISSIARTFTLYKYKNAYYLVVSDINLNTINIKNFFSTIVEFSNDTYNSDTFISKLNECGEIILKHNGIKKFIANFK